MFHTCHGRSIGKARVPEAGPAMDQVAPVFNLYLKTFSSRGCFSRALAQVWPSMLKLHLCRIFILTKCYVPLMTVFFALDNPPSRAGYGNSASAFQKGATRPRMLVEKLREDLAMGQKAKTMKTQGPTFFVWCFTLDTLNF